VIYFICFDSVINCSWLGIDLISSISLWLSKNKLNYFPPWITDMKVSPLPEVLEAEVKECRFLSDWSTLAAAPLWTFWREG